MEQSDFDSITTRVRHLRENIAELEMNYNQLTLNVKVSGNVQQANLDIVQISIHGVRYAQHLLWQALERSLLKSGSPSVTQKERVQQAEPQQVFQVPVRKGVKDVSGQPSTSGVKKEEISLRPQKGPKRDDTNNLLNGVEFDATHFIIDVSEKYPRFWALKGAHPIIVNRWYKFGALASIRIVAPGF
ncbi:hypothetical protein ACS0TY_026750 [Phlomoides rotata]